MRVFLDANVLFSASNSGSNIARLIQRALEEHAVVASDLSVEEARRNIELKRPAWTESFQRLTARVEIVASVAFQIPVELADKDFPILCAAIRAKCQVLATGDRRHFGHLYGESIDGVQVVSLVQLAELLRASK